MLKGLQDRIAQSFAPVENRLSVGRQIGFATAALCFGLVGVMTAGAAYLSRNQAAELIAGQMTQLARSMVNQLDFGLFDIARDLDHFVHLEPLMPAWAGAPEAQRALLEQLRASRPEFSGNSSWNESMATPL